MATKQRTTWFPCPSGHHCTTTVLIREIEPGVIDVMDPSCGYILSADQQRHYAELAEREWAPKHD